MVDKEIYENGSAKLEIIHQDDGPLYYIQSGLVGMYMKWADYADLYELMNAHIREMADG